MTTALHFLDEGPRNAPVLVLGGSLGTTLQSWDPLMPILTQGLRVVRYDHWGHGQTPAPSHASGESAHTVAQLGRDILALLDSLKVERFHVAGISLGGMVAQWLGANHPERVDKLSLICTSARLVHRAGFLARAKQVRSEGMGAALGSVPRWCTPDFFVREPKAQEALEAMVRRHDPEGYAACCEAVADWDGMELLAQIKGETLVISATQDLAITATHGALLAESIAGARFHRLEGSAHVPNLEQPEHLARLLYAHFLPGQPVPSVPGQDQLMAMAERGAHVRGAVLGQEHVARSKGRTTAFNAPFTEMLPWYPWGYVWARDGLTRKERSMVTLALLAALQHDGEFVMHVRAAIRNGLTLEQIQEVILHTGVYAGVPVSNHSFAIAQPVLQELGLLDVPQEK